ncbi:LysM peptidoglycan-binding domain-containing protein [Sulfitobacter sp.]|uniref:LysM peptidoglycan-binding domain-containing protein n=1 Tax=Sulfitobacter sp. TaxID=1903071 RepID=UPI003EF2F71A
MQLNLPNLGNAQDYSSPVDPSIPLDQFCNQELVEQLAAPFKSLEAVNNFIQYVLKNGEGEVDIPDDFEIVAPLVDTWRYEMTRATDSQDCQITYTQVIDLSGLFRDLERSIYKVRRDGCSFFSVRSVDLSLAGPRRIRGVGQVRGKKRTCINLLFGELKTDLGSIEGTVVATIEFKTTAGEVGGRFRGEVFANKPAINQNIKVGDLLGINLDSTIGQALTFLTGGIIGVVIVDLIDDSIIDDVNDAVSTGIRSFSDVVAQSSYLDETGGVVAFDKYIDFISETHQVVFSTVTVFNLDENETRLKMVSGKPVLHVVFQSDVDWEVSRATWASVQQEMRIIGSFDEATRPRVIVSGDNLWAIALQEYGSGFYKGPLAAFNQIPSIAMDKVSLGQELSIPPIHALVGLPGVKFLAPGETAYKLCADEVDLPVGDCLAELRRANPGLDLNMVHVMEPLIIPVSLTTN